MCMYWLRSYCLAVRITANGPGEFRDPLDSLAAVRARTLDTPAAPGRLS